MSKAKGKKESTILIINKKKVKLKNNHQKPKSLSL